ncbi:MAG: bifunctional diaminohydroxyphosphoribosylaminopyrimidine deaminase/5-amino-6-(5-phosphoribosylamino)uracil reductase RibD [Bacteroidota bacterium]|nr:bifunctional diaminohydroxyphosphoribosylaminopyrimidine deaminase/5-amino-6-(5-phosphoribosylamino)uracil reductase RibD [Bacteroidota bacterium]
MHRCIALALLGKGRVAPNPMVGAVLVYEGRIIGEGYHQYYGQAHAEVNCLNSVLPQDRHLIVKSTLYVSLEPCAHFGKTPPCSNLIIENNIPTVVIGCRDPFEQVNGKGIEKLKAAGIEVILGVLEEECIALNIRFFTFYTKKRPYVILKWAQTGDGFIGKTSGSQLKISNIYSDRLVHRWRSEEAAILVGKNTAKNDDPSLNVRLWKGKDPVRLVIDKRLELSLDLRMLNGQQRTVVFNYERTELVGNVSYYRLQEANDLVEQILAACYELKLQSVLVEGGGSLLQSFIDSGFWDEAYIITNKTLMGYNGVKAPRLNESAKLLKEESLKEDMIQHYSKQ